MESRLFLLYTGQIVLKKIINKECYENFMSLNIAMIILLSSDYSFLLDYGRQLLDFFVMSYQNIYGPQFVSHNVHGLLHLCDDYEQYGPLHNCFTFIFENYMKELKSFVRKHEKPLQQVINRYNEKCSANTLNNNFNTNDQQSVEKPVLKYIHNNGPLIDNITGSQYYIFLFKNIKINVKEEKDSFVLTKTNEVVKCLNFCQNGDNMYVIGYKFKITKSFYVDPIDSKKLDIFEVQKLSKNIKHWTVFDLKKK